MSKAKVEISPDTISSLQQTRRQRRMKAREDLVTPSPVAQSSHTYYTCDNATVEMLYQRHRRILRRLIERYSLMDRAHTVEDFDQEARLAIMDFIASWDPIRAVGMKESSYLTWCVLKRFTAVCPGNDKLVQICCRTTGRHVTTMPYPVWIKQKRLWPATFYEHKSMARIVSMTDRDDDIVMPEEMEVLHAGIDVCMEIE